jgi:hypothetical protein
MEGCAMSDLPASAQTKLTALRDAETEMQGQVNAVLAAGNSAHQKAMTSGDEATARQYEEECDRLRERLPALRQKLAMLTQLNGNIRTWLQQNGRAEFVAVKRSKVDIGKQKPADALADIRAQISKLTSEQRRVSFQAVPTLSETKAAASAWVDGLAVTGAPLIVPSHRGLTITFGKSTPIEAILAWVDPEKLKACLHRDIEAAPKADLTMTREARQKRLAEIEAKLSELGLSEEALIEAMQQDGITVLRRPDADPSCVLGVVRKTSAAKAA